MINYVPFDAYNPPLHNCTRFDFTIKKQLSNEKMDKLTKKIIYILKKAKNETIKSN